MTRSQPASPGSSRPAQGHDPRIEELSTAECWRLMEGSTIGRLAVEGIDGAPELFPLNFLVHDGSVFVRSAPGTKLRSIALHPAVALEIDGEDGGLRWSVVIRGTAQRMDTDADIEASGVIGLVSASPTEKNDFVRITAQTVTGRRFRASSSRSRARPEQPASASAADPVAEPRAAERGGRGAGVRAERPRPIPHFTPFEDDGGPRRPGA